MALRSGAINAVLFTGPTAHTQRPEMQTLSRKVVAVLANIDDVEDAIRGHRNRCHINR